MTALAVTADPRISFTSRPWDADNTRVGARAHSEPVGRPFDVTVKQRLVPIEVVSAARDGDRDSLGRLCALIHPRLIGFYRYSGLTATESEDLAGDVVEDVVTRLATLRNSKAFDAWMWSIGRNRLKGWIRVNRRPERYEPTTPSMASPEERRIASFSGFARLKDCRMKRSVDASAPRPEPSASPAIEPERNSSRRT